MFIASRIYYISLYKEFEMIFTKREIDRQADEERKRGRKKQRKLRPSLLYYFLFVNFIVNYLKTSFFLYFFPVVILYLIQIQLF